MLKRDYGFDRVLIGLVSALLAGLSVVAPVGVTLLLAHRQSVDERRDEADRLAREVLDRADATTRQAWAGTRLLEAGGQIDPCSPRQIALMAKIVLTSEQLQGAGFVRGDYLICSAAGRADPPIFVGPPNYVSASGGTVRAPVKLPGMRPIPYIMAGLPSGYVVLIHPKLTVDLFAAKGQASVGIVDVAGKRIINRSGNLDPARLLPFLQRGSSHFVTDGHAVRVFRSKVGEYRVYAAVPLTVRPAFLRNLMYLIPFCALAIGLLVYGLRRLAERENSFARVIHRAIDRGEFFVEYQPIIELASGRIAGAEALLRWTRRTGEQVGPEQFIAMAEDAGVIRTLTRHALQIVADDIRSDIANLQNFYVSLNVSAADLSNEDILAEIRSLLLSSGARPDQLVVEATERSLMDVAIVAHLLARLHGLGLRVAIDDFGTGYSNLAYLDRLNPDLLKIDKSFVESIGTKAVTSQVVAHIIDMAKDLDLDVVAEGIEVEEQAEFLRARGVKYGQGWLYARPMSWQFLVPRVQTNNAPASA